MTYENPNIEVGDIGYNISYVSAPVGAIWGRVAQINHLFSSARQNIDFELASIKSNEEESVSAQEFQDFIYKPAIYFGLGTFDLILISPITTEYASSSRILNTYRSYTQQQPQFSKSIEDRAFYNKTNITSTIVNNEIIGNAEQYTPALAPNYQNGYDYSNDGDSQKRPYNIITVTELKLDTRLMCIFGNVFFSRKIHVIRTLLEESTKEKECTYNILLNHSSWSDLCITIFSNEVSANYQIIERLLTSIADIINSTTFIGFLLSDWHISHSLNVQSSNLTDPKHLKETFQNHIFSSFSRTNDFKQTSRIHLNKCTNIPSIDSTYLREVSLGMSDIVISKEEQNLHDLASFVLTIMETGNLPQNDKSRKTNTSLKRSIYRIETSLIFPSPTVLEPTTYLKFETRSTLLKEKWKYFNQRKSEKVKKFSFSDSALQKLNDSMKNQGYPLTLSESIYHMFRRYNNGIKNKISSTLFLELHATFESLYNEILFAQQNLKANTTDREAYFYFIEKTRDDMQQAVQNRLESSYNAQTQYSNNLYASAGVQKYLTAYNACANIISQKLGNPNLFAKLDGGESIKITDTCLVLNYLHLHSPTLFFTDLFREIPHNLPYLAKNQLWPWDSPPEHVLRFLPEYQNVFKHDLTLIKSNISSEFEEFLGFFDEEFLNHTLPHLISYKLQFFGNDDLCSYFYWAIFLMTTKNSNDIHTISIRDFQRYLLQHLIILKLISPDDFEGYTLEKYSNSLSNDDLSQSMGKLKKFTTHLFKSELSQFFTALKRFVQTDLSQDPEISMSPDNVLLIELTDDLKMGRISSNHIGVSKFSFIQHYIHSYLKILHTESLIEDHNEMSKANLDSQPNAGSTAKILVNHRGGVYINSYSLRRKIQKYRTTVMWTLYFLGQDNLYEYSRKQFEKTISRTE